MAKMIPSSMEIDNPSFGEKQVFDSLKAKLPFEYTVFHSVRWNDRNDKQNVIWGESDFTIFHPKKGIIVIEVKSGGIECLNDRWTYIRTDNKKRYEMKNPLKQADRSKYRFKEIVDDILENDILPNGNKDYCYVMSAVWFPSIQKRSEIGSMPNDFCDEIVLLEDALDKPEKYIDRIYDFYNSQTHTKLSQKHVGDIVRAFAPHYRAMPSLRSKREEQEDVFVRLTKEQNSLLGYLEEQRVAAIQGAAGTGKTWLALAKAKELAKSGKVLFLCFNKFLREDLDDLKKESPIEYANIDFMNLPQLVRKKMGGGDSIEQEDIYYFLDRHENFDWDYKHIVIDEGQDFDDKEIEKLYDIAFLSEGAFYIFYDKNQFVKGKEFPKWLKNVECRLVLNYNCRNTESIASTSGKPLNIEPKVKNASNKGDLPNFYACGEKKNAIKKISSLVDEYRKNGCKYENICIITIKTEEKSFLNGETKIGNHKLVSKRSKDGILFTSARKFKGLESDAVIIIDVDKSTFIDEENKRLFYVGSSRAKHFLDIIHIEDDIDLQSIANAVEDKGRRLPSLARIKLGLNVQDHDCRNKVK